MSGALDPKRGEVTNPIRVLLVDDSPLALALLKRMLSTAPGIRVVGTAVNGQEALQLIPRLDPDVICTDLMMPVVDGLQLTREVMARFPRPILVISSTAKPTEPRASYPVLEAGALDILPKPGGETGASLEQLTRDLVARIRVVAGVHVFKRSIAAPRPTPPSARRAAVAKAPLSPGAGMVVIGASTGGPLVLKTLIEQLPAGYGLPVICVQHISNGFLAGLVDWLGSRAQVRVKIAQSGEAPLPGTVYFPAENRHLEVDTRGRLQCTEQPPLEGHRPSVTTAMQSAARYYGSATVGVLLTGMGSDGGAGLQAISERGGLTIAQDEASCVVFGMPKDAIARGAAQHVLPPSEIARILADLRPLPAR